MTEGIQDRVRDFGSTMNQLLHEEPLLGRAIKAYVSLPENVEPLQIGEVLIFLCCFLVLYRMGKEKAWMWLVTFNKLFFEWVKKFEDLERQHGGPIE